MDNPIPYVGKDKVMELRFLFLVERISLSKREKLNKNKALR